MAAWELSVLYGQCHYLAACKAQWRENKSVKSQVPWRELHLCKPLCWNFPLFCAGEGWGYVHPYRNPQAGVAAGAEEWIRYVPVPASQSQRTAGLAVTRRERVKDFPAKDAVLDKTLTCHKRDLLLEFLSGSNFSGEDFTKSRGGFLLNRARSAPAEMARASPGCLLSRHESCPGEGETGAASPHGMGDSHWSSYFKKGDFIYKDGNFQDLGYYHWPKKLRGVNNGANS